MITSFFRQMREGIISNNPVFVQFLGMCSVLAVTTSVTNALGMGLSVTAVLICSNLFISLLRSFIPKQVRIAGYIIVISGFVTAVELIIKAYLPALDKSLGLFIPLIVVNCIILARAEAFASKNKVIPSVIDGLASGIGYTLAVTAVAFVRELLGTGVLFAAADGTGGLQILGDWYSPATIFIMPAGAFFTLGVLCAVFNTARRAAAKRSEKKSKPKTEAEIPAETEAAV
ncbi:MAG: electron transport complex subunit E [Clostridia bacterium]|nr:electron transport complex subunit E [Clostridia bacterium]